MRDVTTIGFRRRHLPHWTVIDRSYFVTIRLKGSLPAAVLDELRIEKEDLLAQKAQYVRHSCLTSSGRAGMPDLPHDALNEFEQERFARVDAILDAAAEGPKFLETSAVARVVVNAFAWLEESKGWTVHALTVMPNHVHVLLRNERGENDRLNTHLGILKGYTAREANRILERAGSFWMDENFDHWCRGEEERLGYIEYIRMNPVKAGLVSQPEDWPWTLVK